MPTLSSDPCRILVQSDAWCTRRVLESCRSLSRDQFHRRFEMGLGTIHLTLTHILSTMRRWTDRLAGRTPRPMLHAVPDHPQVGGEDKDRSVDELLAILDEGERDLLAVLRPDPAWLAGVVSLEWKGDDGVVKTHSFSRAAVVAHVTTHGYHHRAQVLNMLRHLSVPGVSDKLPELSVVDWQGEVESPPVPKRG